MKPAVALLALATALIFVIVLSAGGAGPALATARAFLLQLSYPFTALRRSTAGSTELLCLVFLFVFSIVAVIYYIRRVPPIKKR